MNEECVKWKFLFEPRIQINYKIAGEFNFHSITNEILSHFFSALIFCYFFIKKKVIALIFFVHVLAPAPFRSAGRKEEQSNYNMNFITSTY